MVQSTPATFIITAAWYISWARNFGLRPDHGIKNIRSLLFPAEFLKVRNLIPALLLPAIARYQSTRPPSPTSGSWWRHGCERCPEYTAEQSPSLWQIRRINKHQIGNVYSKRTIHRRTAGTDCIRYKRFLLALFMKSTDTRPFFLDNPGKGLFDFSGRGESRITIVGQIKMAGIAA